jgi:hypothetical protein
LSEFEGEAQADATLEQVPQDSRHLRTFFFILAGLFVLRLALGFIGVPIPLIQATALVVTVLFMVAPFLALYAGIAGITKPATAVTLLIAGALAHAGGAVVLAYGLVHGPLEAVIAGLAQAGLLMWCLGLGYLVAMIIRDKNLLIPLAIFMAAFDIFLVLTPVGPTRVIMTKAPKVFEAVAMSVPKVMEHPTTGPVAPAAFVGPADLLFTAMFFAVLFRFHMRTRTTLIALVPTLLLYMVLSRVLGPLPALVPIGLCVLIVNWNQFKLTKDEWVSTGVVAVLLGGLLTWALTRPKPPPEPLPKGVSQGAPGQASSPPPASGG